MSTPGVDAPLRAPLVYPGGKRRAASLVWAALGDPGHYVEPFAGSLAVLLARPPQPTNKLMRAETANDLDGLLSNVFRSFVVAPDDVVKHCDVPISEIDLHSRHAWLIENRERITAGLVSDPEWCDPKAAGWWLWGNAIWIGDQWGYKASRQLPKLSSFGNGVHASLNGRGVREDAAGFTSLAEWFYALRKRLRPVRLACGDWKRVCSPAVLEGPLASLPDGLKCGVFLDPPYANYKLGYGHKPAVGVSISADVRAWCIANGANPLYRIVLAGEAGEHEELAQHGWTAQRWRRKGGLGGAQGGENTQDTERLWLSPHCVTADSGPLFRSAL